MKGAANHRLTIFHLVPISRFYRYPNEVNPAPFDNQPIYIRYARATVLLQHRNFPLQSNNWESHRDFSTNASEPSLKNQK